MENNEKIALLNEECDKYLLHLERSINRLSADLAPEARERYSKPDSQAIDIQKIIARNTSKCSLYDITDNIDTTIHSSKRHPKLHAALNKYQAVSEMKQCLSTGNASPENKLQEFDKKLNESRETLSKNLDSSAMKFMKNILHVLTAGLYSKSTRDTFQFWKTQGEVFTENVSDTMKIK